MITRALKDHCVHEMMRFEAQLVTGGWKAMNNSPIISERNRSWRGTVTGITREKNNKHLTYVKSICYTNIGCNMKMQISLTERNIKV